MTIQTLQVGPIGTNCYLLCDETAKVCAAVDPGGSPEWILKAIEKTGCALTSIFLTHGHYDHTGGVEGLRHAWPAVRVYLNRRDTAVSGADMAQLFPPIPDTEDYDEGDTVTVGSLTLTVLATPGHSEGGVTLLCGETMFCGDTLFAGSCGRTDFPGGSTEKIMASLARLAALPGDYKVLPGHMEPSTLERERTRNPYVQMALRGQQG